MRTWMIRHKASQTVVYLGRHRPAVFYPDGSMKTKYGEQLGLSGNQGDYEALDADFDGRCGDVFDGVLATPKPDNYPQPTAEQVRERKIQVEMERLAREQAEQALIDRGEIEARRP